MKKTISEEVFAGGGEMGSLMRSLDWSQTLLGSASEWAQSLKTAVSIILNSHYPMFIWWGSEYANLYNDAYRPILGASKHPQFLGQGAKDCWAEIWDVVGTLANSVLDTGQPTWSENLQLMIDRYGYLEETYFTFSYSPIRDETGGVGGVFCAVIETTERVIGERRLRTLRELASNTAATKTVAAAYRSVAETLAQNQADIPFALLYQVESAGTQARLMGTAGIADGIATPEEIDLTQETDPWHLAEVKQTKQTKMIENLPAEIGINSASSALVIPIAQSGKPELSTIVVLGISRQREFDDEYKGFFDLVVNNIATAVANADAYEVERQRAEALAELDRAKITFFSNISHEFRTPLTLMLGTLEETLANPNGPLPSDREKLEIAHRNSLRLLKLVNTLLDFSRIEAGRMQADYQPTDLAIFTADLAAVFRSAIENAGIRYLVNCPPLPEAVNVDRQMWEKIVLNLLSNAFKFTFAGEISLDLRYCQDHVELEVRDTGTGIPAAELPRIFERFHRVPAAQGRTYEGSGIGLSLVQELVKLHNGTITVSSIVDSGTSFIVSIPTKCDRSSRTTTTSTAPSTIQTSDTYLAEALRWLPQEGNREQGTGNSEESPLSPVTCHLSPSSPRILLVDDNADMREYIQRLLSLRYEVEAVGDGVAALAAIRQTMPDIVLTDIMMPRLDGFSLLRELRADSQTKALPIILLSARAEEESWVAGLADGADDYLIKPFSARELLARVEANLKMAQIRQEVAHYEQRLRLETETARNQITTILESITDAFVALDREWRYTYVNEQATRLFQKTREQLLGKQIWQEVFPEVTELLLYQEFQRAISQQVAVVFEEFIATLGKWLEIHAYPSPDGLAVYFRDITARKRSELALRESEEKFRNIVQTANEGVWLIDQDAHTLYVNDQMAAMLGYSTREIIGSSVLEFCFPEDIPAIQQHIKRNIDGNVDQFDFRFRRKTGQELLVLACTSPVRDGQGNIIGALGMFTNVTYSKRAESALRQSEERYRSLVAATSAVVWITNPLGAFIDLQPSWEEYTGQTWKECAGWGWLQMFHPDDREQVERHWQKALAETKYYEIEARLWHQATGQYRYVIARAVPVLNADGSVREWVGTDTDINKRKQFEEERNSLFAREQAARTQAEEANRVKDEFLAILSHELRSPLNPILGWTRLLQTQKLNADKTVEALATIERNAKLQTQLIDDLLDVSRILRGKLNLNVVPVDLSFIIESAIETMRTAAMAKSIVIQTDIQPVGKIAGDSARLQQIVWNLLSNAIKFTPDDGQVSINLRRVGKYAEITVSDTGKGIEPDFLPYVFDYFRQADASITRRFGGLGLGLAIVRHLVELHGGTVTAASPGEGLGATFTVMLPLLPVQSQNNQEEGKSINPVLNLAGVRVLIVEDDSDSRDFLIFALEEYDATVLAAANAAAGFEIVQQFQPDILISDIGMPIEDGYSLIRRIRAWEATQNRKIPAIALTAYAKNEDSQQALAAGFQKHLPKPVEPAQLVSAIASLLDYYSL
ncbi:MULTISPECIES: ATP-binding protein [unclassified Nostoc]|uniref:ATP-binding protein n=1 Tax=unclassified Nostoc TaxID=2593658 RepID=UPI001F558D68|nr:MULTISPECIES: ATP-binding protein [unclassified Nostoc]